MKLTTGAAALVDALESLDTSVVFGIPGIHNLDIYDHLLDSPIHHVTGRNESGVAFMADGYASSTGQPGVALVISGPGLTNTLTALGEARHDSVPLVLISSDIPRKYRNGPRGYLHQLESPTAMTATVTKERIRVEAVEEIQPALSYLYRVATEGRPGPVHLEIPIDVLQERSNLPDRIEAVADQIAMEIAAARSVWIVAGGGTSTVGDHLLAFAEALDASIVTTAAGKGAIPETHDLSFGGRLHLPAVREAVAGADLLFLLGTQLSSTDLWVDDFLPTGTVVAINIDASHLDSSVIPEIAIRGDLAEVLPALTAGITARKTERPAVSRRSARDRLIEEATAQLPTVLGLPTEVVTRMRIVIEAIADALGDDGVLAADMTTIAYAAISEFSAKKPGSFLHPAGFGTLGFALPAAIGCALRPDPPPIAVLVGDGGFQFTMQEFAVAVQEELSIPIILWNDAGYGEIRREQEARHAGQRIAVDNIGPDFVALAQAYGATGQRIDDPALLKDAVTTALSRSGPTIIEVPREPRGGR